MPSPIDRLIGKCREAVAEANARWLEETGEAEPPLCANEWQLINHLAKWAFDEGLVDRLAFKGEAAHLLCGLDPEAKRDVWGEALWYLEETLPARFHPIIRSEPRTGPEFVAWLVRVASGAGGRIAELVRNWACRKGWLGVAKGEAWPDVDEALRRMADWSPPTVAEALAEARRLLDFTAGMDVEVAPDGSIRTSLPEWADTNEEAIPA